jgi:hypothetical protein
MRPEYNPGAFTFIQAKGNMARRPSLALLIVVTGAFFLLGLYSVFLQGGGATSGPTRVSDPSSAISSPTQPAQSGQSTILILGVDSLEKAKPTLKAVWYLTYQLPVTDVFLLGVPTNLQLQSDPSHQLDQAFAWTPDAGVAPDFLSGLKATVPLDFNTWVVIDDTGFAAAVDFLGGLKVNGTTFSGQQVLGILSLASADARTGLSTQKQVLEGLSAQAEGVGQSPDLTPLVDLVPEHIYLTSPLGQLVAMISPVLPIRPETTHIELY